jgi:hypothetical protein
LDDAVVSDNALLCAGTNMPVFKKARGIALFLADDKPGAIINNRTIYANHFIIQKKKT